MPFSGPNHRQLPEYHKHQYIHLTRENFMSESNVRDINTYSNIKQSLQSVYQQSADRIRARYVKSRQFEDDTRTNVRYATEMQKVLDLYASVKNGDVENAVLGAIQSGSTEMVEQIKNLHSQAGKFQHYASKAPDILADVKELSEYAKSLNDLIESMDKFDKLAIDIAANEAKVESAQNFSSENGLFMLSAFQTGQTSLKNLKQKVDIVEKALKNTKGKKVDIGQKVSYYDHSKQKTVSRRFSELFGGIPIQLTNIQGGIGETMTYLIAEHAIQDNFFDGAFGKDVKIKMADGSNVQTIESQLYEGVKATGISDSAIEIEFDGKGGKSTVSLGISSKAVFADPDPKKKSQKSTATHFGTTTVQGLLARAQQDISKGKLAYLLTNMLAPQKQSLENTDPAPDLYKETENIRRYLAARAMNAMLGGLGTGLGGNIDTVYFISYQDKLFSVSDYFEGLANQSANQDTLPLAHITRKAVNNSPEAPGQDGIPGAMYRRSTRVRSEILSMSANVSISYGGVKKIAGFIDGL